MEELGSMWSYEEVGLSLFLVLYSTLLGSFPLLGPFSIFGFWYLRLVLSLHFCVTICHLSWFRSIDELKQKLLCTTIELESLKVVANEAMRRHKDDVKQLISLVKIAYKERDEAKEQLQKLFLKIMPSSPTQSHPILPQAQPGSPFVLPARANSSITESNSLSDTYNHQSHGSSPVDSFFDAVTSPDFSSINIADSNPMGFANKSFVLEGTGCVTNNIASPPAVTKMDHVDSIIDGLVKGKLLPQKGKLLQSVMEAGPLLQTLILAGPLPRWRNPPQLQTFKIPLVSLKGYDTANHTSQKTAANKSCIPQKPVSLPSCPEISRDSSQMCSASMLNVSGGSAASALGNASWLLNSGTMNHIPAGKRQRLL